jgi:hypothetical protein
LYVELGPYGCHVFLDFREVTEYPDGRYAQITAYLGGRGVPSIDIALREMFLQPVLTPFRELVSAATLRELAAWADRRAVQRGVLPAFDGADNDRIDSMLEGPDAFDEPTPEELEALAQRRSTTESAVAPSTPVPTTPEQTETAAIERFEQHLRTFLTEFAAFTASTIDTNRIVTDVVHRLETMIDLMVCADEHQAQRIGAPLAGRSGALGNRRRMGNAPSTGSHGCRR